MKHAMLALGFVFLAGPAFAAPKWDRNGDGKMTRDEFVAIASARMVERADTDKDGRLSLDEWKARPTAAKSGAAGRGDPTKRFARLDKDKDGFVVAADFSARLERRFDRMDTNHDGVLTQEERRAVRGK